MTGKHKKRTKRPDERLKEAKAGAREHGHHRRACHNQEAAKHPTGVADKHAGDTTTGRLSITRRGARIGVCCAARGY